MFELTMFELTVFELTVLELTMLELGPYYLHSLAVCSIQAGHG